MQIGATWEYNRAAYKLVWGSRTCNSICGMSWGLASIEVLPVKFSSLLSQLVVPKQKNFMNFWFVKYERFFSLT